MGAEVRQVMTVADATTTILWAIFLVMALLSVVSHLREAWLYHDYACDPARTAADRDQALVWMRDEYDRAVLKSFLAVAPLGFLLLRLGVWFGVASPSELLSLIPRALGLIGVGGAICWGTWWRVRVRRARWQYRARLARETASEP